jgi:hypothetical protein
LSSSEKGLELEMQHRIFLAFHSKVTLNERKVVAKERKYSHALIDRSNKELRQASLILDI